MGGRCQPCLIAVHVDTYGTFANNFIQLLLAIQFSLIIGVKTIFLDESFCWLTLAMTLPARFYNTVVAMRFSPTRRPFRIHGTSG
jgi:hypothetical protein